MSLLAALFFIFWGLTVNWHHGWSARIQVATTQGLISLVSTYLSAELIKHCVERFHTARYPAILGGAVSYALIYSFVLGGHFLAGTPEFWTTVLPGMLTGLVFCFGYAKRVATKKGRLARLKETL